MRTLLPLALLAIGCGRHAEPEQPVSLDWDQGESWHLAASYKAADLHTESGAVSLDGSEVPHLGEVWSDEVVWKMEVIETGLRPQRNDELFPYAVGRKGAVQPLTVIRASIDPLLNPIDEPMLEADPVIYLVYREKKNRLAAVIEYTSVDGARVDHAWSTKDLDRSDSPLSLTMFTTLPTYLAPYGVKVTDGTRILENGSTMHLSSVDADTVDATFDDAFGGGGVSTRYRVGENWPVSTMADHVSSRLLTQDEADALRRSTASPPPPPEDFDYRAALEASIDLDDAMTLSSEMISGEMQAFEAHEGFLPWTGSWWPQSEGALVFGYNDRPTLSNHLKEEAEPLRTELDAIKEDLSDLEGDAYDEKHDEYTTKHQAYIDVLVAFYNGVRDDLDGGQLTLEDGKLVHADGWEYLLDELSPMDKAALALYENGHTEPNPFFVPAWELLNHWSPGGGSWWGHCNGWAGAAILTLEPTEELESAIGDQPVVYTTADQKGLLSETHYSTTSQFYGARYYNEDDDISDLTPAAFHRILTFYVRDQGVPLVFDTTASEEVWNFPAYGAGMELTETTKPNQEALLNVNTATENELDDLPGIGGVLAERIIDYRELVGPFQSVEELTNVSGLGSGTLDKIDDLVAIEPATRTFEAWAYVEFATDGVDETHVDGDDHPYLAGFSEVYEYTLVTDLEGRVLRGTWADDTHHPDFAWVPYNNTAAAGSSENPYLSQTHLDEALGADLSKR